MRISSVDMVILSYLQKQETCFNQYQLAFTSKPDSTKPKVFSMPYIKTNNDSINKKMTLLFDNAFATGDTKALLEYINTQSRLKPKLPRAEESALKDVSFVRDENNQLFPVISATAAANGLSLIVDKTAHIQVIDSSMGNIFLEKDYLSKEEMDETGQYIVTGGVRGLDPTSQDYWEKAIGRGWPPADDTRAPEGVANLTADKSGGIFINTPSSVGKAYGTHPRALAILDAKNNSIIFAFQQDNLNPNFKFGAWAIAPFRIREGKKTLAVFPIEKTMAQRFNNPEAKEFKEIHESGQWSVFGKEKKFFMVDASNPPKESANARIDSYANGAIFATEGDNKICLMRSCFEAGGADEKFKIYSEREAGGGKKYLELEFMAPKVKAGNKSTLIWRLEFIPLEKMGLPPTLTPENMNDTIQKAANILL